VTEKDKDQRQRFERRWPVGIAIVAVVFLLALLPGRLRFFPAWVLYALGLAVLLPVVAAGASAGRSIWRRVERVVTIIFFLATLLGTLATLAVLIGAMLSRPTGITGRQLLASSISTWVTNVLIFALLYWQVDRGGPEARLNSAEVRPDWLFPQEGAPAADVPAGWQAAFVDYLFVAYTTGTAFSPTHALPLTVRAQLLMMLESAISLVTIIVVAARAINILGS